VSFRGLGQLGWPRPVDKTLMDRRRRLGQREGGIEGQEQCSWPPSGCTTSLYASLFPL